MNGVAITRRPWCMFRYSLYVADNELDSQKLDKTTYFGTGAVHVLVFRPTGVAHRREVSYSISYSVVHFCIADIKITITIRPTTSNLVRLLQIERRRIIKNKKGSKQSYKIKHCRQLEIGKFSSRVWTMELSFVWSWFHAWGVTTENASRRALGLFSAQNTLTRTHARTYTHILTVRYFRLLVIYLFFQIVCSIMLIQTVDFLSNL